MILASKFFNSTVIFGSPTLWYLSYLSLYFLIFCLIKRVKKVVVVVDNIVGSNSVGCCWPDVKAHANGPNIVGQQHPTIL